MIKIGFVGLDTSHPASFVQILNKIEGVRVTGIFDPGDVRSDSYIENFCSEHDCQRFHSPEAMADHVDAAMILGVNWDRHLALATPFLDRRKPLYIDKPVCGNREDLHQFEKSLSHPDTLFLAGSGWRFNEKVRVAAHEIAKNPSKTIYVESCFPSYFYGIHAAELAIGLLGEGFESVQTFVWDEAKSAVLFALKHSNGKTIIVKLSPSQAYWRGALYRHADQWKKVEFDGEDIHGSVCQAFVKMLQTGQSIYSVRSCLESVRIFLAARESALSLQETPIDAAPSHDIRFDGNAFVDLYRKG